jgi:glucosyl-3-phosphoglycerate synthase
MGYAFADKRVHTIALHDCDIKSYRREMLARLVWPIVDPGSDFEFSKGYYARVNAKLYGRVTRLFYTPLVRTLKQLKAGQSGASSRFFDFLDSFRYALSGEFAFIRSLAKGVRISPSWGLEVSLLGEVFEKTNVERVCQVEIADTYDHKHQPLSKGDPSRGLVRMASDIAGTLFRIMAQGGFVMSKSFFDTLLASYLRQTRTAIEQYSALAQINGLHYDRHAEIEAVEAFVEALRAAEESFRSDPIGAPLMSPWVRVRSALPDFSAELEEAVTADNDQVRRPAHAASRGE